jgi:hypothetical protein
LESTLKKTHCAERDPIVIIIVAAVAAAPDYKQTHQG